MCTVTYNVSAVLCLMIGMDTANKVNTLLFHPYDDIGPCIIVIFSGAYTQLDAHYM